jgi:hypothetical protein
LTWCRQNLGDDVEETPIEVRIYPLEVPGFGTPSGLPASCSLNAKNRSVNHAVAFQNANPHWVLDMQRYVLPNRVRAGS